jgi:hypothetical protein
VTVSIVAIGLSGCSGPTGPSVAAVSAPSVISLTISSSIRLVTPVPNGQTLQFIATANFSDGSQSDVTPRTSWSASSAEVATVSPTGLLQTLRPGDVDVSASFGGLSTTVHIVAAHDLNAAPFDWQTTIGPSGNWYYGNVEVPISIPRAAPISITIRSSFRRGCSVQGTYTDFGADLAGPIETVAVWPSVFQPPDVYYGSRSLIAEAGLYRLRIGWSAQATQTACVLAVSLKYD